MVPPYVFQTGHPSGATSFISLLCNEYVLKKLFYKNMIIVKSKIGGTHGSF
jgi:hypothetical protein